MGGCFMSKITDYAFLKKTFGTSGVNVIGSFQLSQLNSSSVQSQLKAAGIQSLSGFGQGSGKETRKPDGVWSALHQH